MDSISSAVDRDTLTSQLSNAVALVAKEDQIAWTIFGIFWAANVLLLGALFVTGKFPDPGVGLVISLVGMLLCVVWSLIQSRALRFLAFYEQVQRALERELLRDASELSLSPSLSDRFDSVPGTKVRARTLMLRSGALSVMLWIASATAFMVKLF